jgi:hypothetical protein
MRVALVDEYSYMNFNSLENSFFASAGGAAFAVCREFM